MAGRKGLDVGGDAFLGPLQRGQEYQLLVGDGFADQVAVRQGLLQRRVYDFLFDQEQLARLVLQQLDRQGAVAVAGRLQQDMTQARAGPNDGVVRDANLLRDLVGGLEADAVDVLRQAIGVGLDLVDCALAVGLVDAHRPARADAVGVEEHHDFADDFLLGPRFLNAMAALRPDAVHVLQPGGLLLDDVENLLAEFYDQLLGVNGTNALNHAAAQIFLDALLRGRRSAVEHVSAELEAKLLVLDPASLGGHPLPSADGCQGADHGDQVAVPFGLHLEHGPSVLLVVERNAFDQPGKAFMWSI